jgi:hypothetical protein
MIKKIKDILIKIFSNKQTADMNKKENKINYQQNDILSILNKKIYSVAEHDGWVSINLEEAIPKENLVVIVQELLKTESEWIDKIPIAWFRNIGWFNNTQLFSFSYNIKNSKKDETHEDILLTKRLLTVSCILYKFKLPLNLIQIDHDTVIILAKYIIITKLYWIDANTTLPGTSKELVNVPNLNNAVKKVLNNTFFQYTINNLNEKNRWPNFIILYEGILNNEPEDSTLKYLTLFQMKKVVSALLLLNKIAIPRDYLYLDLQVIDFANNVD